MNIQQIIHQHFYPFYIRRWAERFFKVENGQVVIDAGAYLGGFTFYAAKKIGKTGKIIAFEPDPKNYQILRKSVEDSNFKNIILLNKALGDSIKEVELESANHFSSVVIKTSKKPTYKVQQTTIDQEMSRLGIKNVDFIKMNIEGAEINAIKGAVKTLSNTHHLAISCHDVQWENTSLAIKPLLEKLGFSVKVIKRKKFIFDFGHIDAYGFKLNKIQKLPIKFTLTIKPEEYLKQGISHCGAYSVKAILSAFEKDTKDHPKEYHPSLIGKITGATLNRQYWADVLESHGVKASAKTAEKLPDTEKLEELKKILADNRPVMIAIANAYNSQGKYIPIRKYFMGHWITLWGYDDIKQTFYVYDSCIPRERYDASIPIGNTRRTYKQLLRDWEGSLLSMVVLRGIEKYHFIEVNLKN